MSRIAELVTNTVTWFVQAKDRTKIRVKRDDLDTLTEVWTGPSGYEDTFVPPVGRVHPQYNLMTVISTNTRRLEAGMTEITVNYHGKLANAGASGYSSVPTVNKFWLEGEVTYQVSGSSGASAVFQTNTGPLVWEYSQTGIVSYSRRYVGRCVELAYITNRVPSGAPSGIGLAKGFLGFLNVWDTMSGFTPGMTISGGGTIEQMTCTDVRVEDSADGWYHVTETYQSRMFPGPIYWQAPPPTLTTATKIVDSVSKDSSSNSDGQNQNVISFDGGNTSGAAQGTASSGGYSIGSSYAGTPDAGNYYELGMDTAWAGGSDSTSSSDTYSAASDAASGGDSSSGTNAVESTAYDG